MDWASDTALGVRRSAFNAVASGFASGLASSRVLVADSNVSLPANAAAAITALMNFNITVPITAPIRYVLAAPKLAIKNAPTP